MPDAIEVRKIPLHSVSDASELTKLIDAGILDAVAGEAGTVVVPEPENEGAAHA